MDISSLPTATVGQTSAIVIADSVNQYGKRITTFSLKYWRAIHGEVMTHRVFSRNASSSRAIPVHKMIQQVIDNPFIPTRVGRNKPGMQASEYLDGQEYDDFIAEWKAAGVVAAEQAKVWADAGIHKQQVNRILEPWQIMNTVLTATDFDNFYELRRHPDAEPHIELLADCMFKAQNLSTPVLRTSINDWHLPYITEEERQTYPVEKLLAFSTARCARVSYMTHEGKVPTPEKDLQLYEDLVGSRPLHASPSEHQAFPCPVDMRVKNFDGWVQHRAIIESNLWANI